MGHVTERVTTIATIDEYCRLPRDLKPLVPDSVKADLKAQIDQAARKHTEALRAERPEPCPDTNREFLSLCRREVSPASPSRDSHREGRGQNPTKPCPNVRQILVRDMHGATKLIHAHCKSRGCPACSQPWIDERTRAVERLAEGHDGHFEAMVLMPDEWPKVKKAMQRARKKGVEVNGVKVPTSVDGMLVVLLARGCDTQICRSVPATRVADPVKYANDQFRMAASAAQEANDIPHEHRPKIGQVRGLGSWDGRLSDPEVEPMHETELIGETTNVLTLDEVKKSIYEYGGVPGLEDRAGVQAHFKSKVDEARWFAFLGLVESDERCNPF